MRNGYRRCSKSPYVVHLTAPDGALLAEALRNPDKDFIQIISKLPKIIGHRNVDNEDELEKALCAMAEEHYQAKTKCHGKFRDRLNGVVDYPVVKLIVYFAAIVAAVASVLTLVRELST